MRISRLYGMFLAVTVCTTAHAEMSAEELAKLAQNPVGNLISMPFQNNTNFNLGPADRTQNILNIQPVIPITLNEDWNLITRTIMPDSGNQWTVPLGGGVGKIFHFGKLPVNTQVGAYYNVVTPDNAANWSTRLQVQFMFPK